MKKLIYLDNAATSYPKPKAVAAAMARAMERAPGNPGRSFHAASLEASRIIFNAREETCHLLGLPNPQRLVFTRNATEGLNLAIKGLLRPGDKVAISRLEHNSVIRPVKSMEKAGVKVDYAPCLPDGTPDPARLPDVKMLVTVAAGNVNGALSDVKKLAGACRKKGILFVLDAAQAAGSIPLAFQEGLSALAAPGHKGLLGPQGVGVCWFAPGVEPSPMIEGGTGSASESEKTPAFWPDRHEAGTMNTPGLAGLLAGVRYIARRGVEDIREHEKSLAAAAMEAMGNHEKIILYPPFDAEKRAALVLFNVKGAGPGQVSEALDREGAAVRAGLHCCPEGHRFLGTNPEGAVRASFGPFTAKKDVKRFMDILAKVIKSL